jgi:iron(III) transport system substrate-binding protein
MTAPLPAQAQGEVNVYTTREPKLIQPLFDAFTKQSGIKVNAIFVEKGMAERVAAEGANSPADIMMAVDVGTVLDGVSRGVTQGVQSAALTAGIPGPPARQGRPLVRALAARALLLRLQRARERQDHDLCGSR